MGVCLGLQCLGVAFGAKIIQSKKLVYGKTDALNHNSSKLFKGINSPFKAARYNSLVIDAVTEGFELSAWDNCNDIMAIEHKHLPIYGVQFHPESFMTKVGPRLIGNFLNENFNY